MPEFRNREEYEKWKADRMKGLGEKKIESTETISGENNKEEVIKTKDSESGQVWNEKKDSNLKKITFLILSILVFLGLFGISKLLLTPTGFIIKIGLPLLVLVFSLLLVIFSFVNLLKRKMEHFALSMRLLSVTILILVCSSVAFTYFQTSKTMTLVEEKGRLASSLKDEANEYRKKADELKDKAEWDEEARSSRTEYIAKSNAAFEASSDASKAEDDALLKMLETKIWIGWDELVGALFILFGNLGIIVLSLFSRKRSRKLAAAII